MSFGTGSGTVSTGFIRKVAIVPEGSRTLYTVTYRDEQGDQDLSFYYQPAAETLQLKNQKQIVWRKLKITEPTNLIAGIGTRSHIDGMANS